jgi:hypothetical protein
MKAGRQHRVSLSDAAIAVLGHMRQHRRDGAHPGPISHRATKSPAEAGLIASPLRAGRSTPERVAVDRTRRRPADVLEALAGRL